MSDAGETHRRLLLVVGIGRSGTSLFSGIVGRLGYRVPQPEVVADDTNPRGFGEPQWVVDFHQRHMRERRVTVFDSRPAAWETMAGAAGDPAASEELRSWLRVHFVGAERIVIKDPRVGWFLPIWERCAGDLGAELSFTTMLRHPAEVVASARTWYGKWQNDASRTAAWLNVTLRTEHATRGSRRAFVRYDDLLADWPAQVSRVGRALGDPALAEAGREGNPDVDALVDPDLRRSAVGWDDVAVPSSLRGRADEVWELVTRLARTDAREEEAVHGELDEARESYASFYAEAEAITQSSVTAVKPRKEPAAAAPARRARADRPASRLLRVARLVPARYRRRVPVGVRRGALQATRRLASSLRR